MATIYTKDGQQVYDEGGKTYNANTGSLFGQVSAPQPLYPKEQLALNPGLTNPTNSITSSDLTPATPLNLPQTPQSDVGMNLNTLNSLTKLVNPEPTTTETAQNDVSKRILELTKNIGGKEQYQAEQDKALGVTELNNQLRLMQAEQDALAAEAAGIPSLIQEQFAGTGATKAGIAPHQADLVRTNLLKSLSLQAKASFVQGNLANARDTVDRMVKIKFAPMEDELKYLQTAYSMNKDTLDREDKKRSDKLGIYIAERTRILNNQREDYKAVQALTKAAMVNNPGNQAALMAAQQAEQLDPSDPAYLQKVFALVGQYQTDPVAVKKAILDNENAKLQQDKLTLENALAKETNPLEVQKKKADIAYVNSQIAKNNADAAKARADASGTSSTGSTTGSVSGDVKDILEGRNTMYNIRQTMGRTNKAAAYMEQIRNQIRAVDPNFDFVASDAGGKSVSSGYVQKATAAINAVLPNIDKIVDLSNQVQRLGVAKVDNQLQKAAVQIGNKKVANFREAQKLIADEIGVALGAGTVSDMKLQLGFDVTDPSVSQEVFASNMGIVKEFINNRKAGLDSLRYSSNTTKSSGKPVAGSIIESGGKKYKVAPDGETLIPQ